jgi:hypothetical protein
MLVCPFVVQVSCDHAVEPADVYYIRKLIRSSFLKVKSFPLSRDRGLQVYQIMSKSCNMMATLCAVKAICETRFNISVKYILDNCGNIYILLLMTLIHLFYQPPGMQNWQVSIHYCGIFLISRIILTTQQLLHVHWYNCNFLIIERGKESPLNYASNSAALFIPWPWKTSKLSKVLHQPYWPNRL